MAGVVEDVARDGGEVDAAEGAHEAGHDSLERGEGWGVEVDRGRGVLLFDAVDDGARVHEVAAVGELDGGDGPCSGGGVGGGAVEVCERVREL